MDNPTSTNAVEDVEPGIHRRRTLLPDGRYLIYYTFDRRKAAGQVRSEGARSAAPTATGLGAESHV